MKSRLGPIFATTLAVLFACTSNGASDGSSATGWHWDRACSSEYEFQSDKAVCANEAGLGMIPVRVNAAVVFNNCLVGRGWRHWNNGTHPSCPAPTSSPTPAPAEPRLSFDECFAKCRELTSRTPEECFDTCKAP